MASIEELERAAETKYGLPEGLISSVRQQETGGQQKYIDAPDTYHYAANEKGQRIAGHTGRVSTAFGPYGILESTAAQPGYGTAPLKSKDLASQVEFAASYLAGRIKHAGSVHAGLAGYGEGAKYADKVLSRVNSSSPATKALKAMTPNVTQDVSQVETAGQAVIDRTNAAAAALKSYVQDSAKLSQASADIVRGQADDAQLVKETEQLAKANAQRNTLNFATVIGSNPDAASYALNKFVEQSNKLYDEQRAISARIANAGNPSTMFERPGRWLADYLLLPYNQTRLKAVSDQLKSTNDQIKWINDTTQNVSQTNTAIAQSTTVASAKAAARTIAAEAATRANTLEIQALSTNADGLLKVTHLENTPFSIMTAIQDQRMQLINGELARQNAAVQAQRLQMEMKNSETAQQAETEFLDTFNRGAADLGMMIFGSYQQFENAARAGIISKESIAMAYQSGYAINNGGQAQISQSPGKALDWYTKATPDLDPGRKELLDKIGRVFQDANGNTTLKNRMTGPNGKASAEGVDSVLREQFERHRENITAGGTDNIYRAPPLAALMSNKALQNSYIGSKIIEPLQRAGATELPWTQVVSKLMDSVINGEVDVAEADSELKFLAVTVAQFNDNHYRYASTAGLPNMSEGFQVPVDVPTKVLGLFKFDPTSNAGMMPSTIGAAPRVAPTQRKNINLLDDTARSVIWTAMASSRSNLPTVEDKVE
jgi:hypothetical protein